MRDIRNKGWFWIENSLIDRDDLNPYEKLLYMTLARYCDNDGKCFPAIETLMKATGINGKVNIGATYIYENVTEDIYNTIINAKTNPIFENSHGKCFDRLIRKFPNEFPYTKID